MQMVGGNKIDQNTLGDIGYKEEVVRKNGKRRYGVPPCDTPRFHSFFPEKRFYCCIRNFSPKILLNTQNETKFTRVVSPPKTTYKITSSYFTYRDSQDWKKVNKIKW